MQTKRKSDLVQQIDKLLMDLPTRSTPYVKNTNMTTNPSKLRNSFTSEKSDLYNIMEEEEIEEKRSKRCDSGIFLG